MKELCAAVDLLFATFGGIDWEKWPTFDAETKRAAWDVFGGGECIPLDVIEALYKARFKVSQ